MKFNEVKESVILAIAARKTPVVVGERGLGKTQMMREIAKIMNMKFINIDCNLLKEGEIGGLPIPTKLENGTIVTTYAVHSKIKQILEWVAADPECKIMLFLDELNRTTRETMSELMNLILNKEINGVKIPENVSMVAAMNPSSSTSGYEGNTDYGVTDMDVASKNRLVWTYLTVDTSSWLNWAIEKPGANHKMKVLDEIKFFDPSKYDMVIEQSIVEFIAKFPQLLNCPLDNVDVCPSSRTWEFASDLIRTYNENRSIFNELALDTCLSGCVGAEAFTQYKNFVENNTNPLIDAEDFFKGKVLDPKIREKFENDIMPRQIIMALSIGRFLSEKSRVYKAEIARITEVFGLMAIDIRLNVMRQIANDYESLHDKLIGDEDYLCLYTDSISIAQ